MRESGFDVSFALGLSAQTLTFPLPYASTAFSIKEETDLQEMPTILGYHDDAEKWEAPRKRAARAYG